MMRQIGKQILTIAAWLLLVVAAPADGLLSTIVTDPLTGVAIDGYDPVTYFTDSEPRLGKPDFEYDWAGVPWYFVSAANRDVFMRNPTVYAPQFGGHCLMSLARGYLHGGSVLLIDELPASLVQDKAGEFLRRFIDRTRGKRTLIFVSQHQDMLALADSVLEIRDGQLHYLARSGAAETKKPDADITYSTPRREQKR